MGKSKKIKRFWDQYMEFGDKMLNGMVKGGKFAVNLILLIIFGTIFFGGIIIFTIVDILTGNKNQYQKRFIEQWRQGLH